jgi:hypothetical protein
MIDLTPSPLRVRFSWIRFRGLVQMDRLQVLPGVLPCPLYQGLPESQGDIQRKFLIWLVGAPSHWNISPFLFNLISSIHLC